MDDARTAQRLDAVRCNYWDGCEHLAKYLVTETYESTGEIPRHQFLCEKHLSEYKAEPHAYAPFVDNT